MTKIAIVSMSVLLIIGISSCNSDKNSNNQLLTEIVESVSSDTAKIVTLCGHCGQVKGSEKCCVPGAAKCEKCGLDKGSPGCCKITSDTDICTKCGEIAGSEKCCKSTVEICSKCGLHKGSPGCCKL